MAVDTDLLARLRRERDPDIDAMRRERDAGSDDQSFYAALLVLLETGVQHAIGEWRKG